MGSGPAWPPRPSAGREERAAWRGPRGAGEGCGRKPVSAPPPSGAPGGDPRPGGSPKVGDAVGAPRSPRIPEWPGGEREPGSRAVPCAPSKWRPPLRVEATGDRLRPAQGPSPFPPPLPSPALCPQPGGGPRQGLPLMCPAAFVSLQRRCSPASPRWRGVSPKSSAATPGATIFFTPMESASS